MPSDTSAKTLLVNVGIFEDQNAIDGNSKLTFEFSSNVVQEDNTVQFTHNETITCNNGTPLKLANSPYTLKVPWGGEYKCYYTGFTPDKGLLTPVPIVNVPAGSLLAPQRPSPSSTGYTIKYKPDPHEKACDLKVDAKDSANNDVSGSSKSDQGEYQGSDITSLVESGSILLQRTCIWKLDAPFNTVNLTYESIARVDVTWSY
jgi:hypothetical protein